MVCGLCGVGWGPRPTVHQSSPRWTPGLRTRVVSRSASARARSCPLWPASRSLFPPARQELKANGGRRAASGRHVVGAIDDEDALSIVLKLKWDYLMLRERLDVLEKDPKIQKRYKTKNKDL